MLAPTAAPPLGLLYLVSALRERFGAEVQLDFVDMKAQQLDSSWLARNLDRLRPDVLAVSALNCEAHAAHEAASLAKRWKPEVLTVLGGPYPHKRDEEILQKTDFDWTFSGPADRSFPDALERFLDGGELGDDIPGFSYKTGDSLHISTRQDSISDLDSLPHPAWDLIDFDLYARLPNQMNMLKGRRYAPIFTSRGCPYKCNYCHDIFSKRFYHRSADHVLEEIEMLYEQYGVDEFEIVDDIFNLHKPRLKQIMSEAERRWGGRIHFCFPNGVRGDILDESVIDALKAGGTYALTIAIETVTPRLQDLVEKYLQIDKAGAMIDAADRRGMVVQGFFMLGFPTESVREMNDTVDFALRSRLTLAHFFNVIPQPATPLYPLAMQESPRALAETDRAQEGESGGVTARSAETWYQRAYGFPLGSFTRRSHMRFYLHPWRLHHIATRVPPRSLWKSGRGFLRVITHTRDPLQN